MKKTFLLTLFALSVTFGAAAQQVALKTNLLYWATTTPNLGVELALSKHSTISISGNYNPWIVGDDGQIKHWLVQPEYRYWFAEKFTRAFVGVHVVGGQYNMGGFKLPYNIFPAFHTNHFDGWAVGAGVSIGYDFYISPHWCLETVLGVGYARTSYTCVNAKGQETYTRSRNYFGPTQIGVTFVYLFNSRK